MTVVPMSDKHIDQLMPYERELFGAEAWSAGGYRDEIADTRNRYYVAVEGADGNLLGWAGVLVIGETAEILTVGVVPSGRRQGLARRMLADLYAEAIRRGARELFLEVRVDNESAQQLYLAEGFAVVGRRPGYYANGKVDAVVMQRAL